MFAVICVITVGVDQGSKAWARGLEPGRHEVISGYWDWEPAQNPGAAFSTFPGGAIVLSIIGAVALAGIGIAASRTPPEHRMRLAGLALIGGGALGNLIDRLRMGSVTDFVRWHVHEHLWPIFNVADAALLVGVVLLLAQRRPKRRLRDEALAAGRGAGRVQEQ
jgi:signal peptidase II